MKKKLNITSITNELEESAFFKDRERLSDRKAVEPPQPKPEALNTPLPEKPIIQETQASQAIPERAIDRSTVRPNGRRIITRNCFEIYEDQMDSLRKLSFEDKMGGKLGSMSAMVREAIDSYLQSKATRKLP